MELTTTTELTARLDAQAIRIDRLDATLTQRIDKLYELLSARVPQ